MDGTKLTPKKKRKVYQMEVDPNDNESGVFAISLVAEPAIENNFVYMSKQRKQVELATVAPDKRLLIGPVLIPGKLIPRIDDATGEEYDITFTPDVIEKAAHLYLQRQENNNITLEHNGTDVADISTVESWIVNDPKRDKSNQYDMEFPKGSWLVTMKVNNPDVWNNYVKTGMVKGFSVEALLGHEPIKLGYNTTGYDQQTQTRGLAVPPPTYNRSKEGTTPPPFALPPNWGGPSTGEMYANLSNYDSIWLTKISDLIKAEYNGNNYEEVLAKIKNMLEENLVWAEFDTAVSVGSSYAGQFGNAPQKKNKMSKGNYFYKK